MTFLKGRFKVTSLSSHLGDSKLIQIKQSQIVLVLQLVVSVVHSLQVTDGFMCLADRIKEVFHLHERDFLLLLLGGFHLAEVVMSHLKRVWSKVRLGLFKNS